MQRAGRATRPMQGKNVANVVYITSGHEETEKGEALSTYLNEYFRTDENTPIQESPIDEGVISSVFDDLKKSYSKMFDEIRRFVFESDIIDT